MFKVNLSGNKYYAEKIGRNYKNLPAEYKFILHAWQNQRRRCYSKGSINYSDYGNKGIRVQYSLRELIAWYHFKKNKKESERVIGRIDHSKGYSLDNIRLETKSFSSLERIERVGAPVKKLKLKITNKKTNEVEIVIGLKDAAKKLNLNHKTLSRLLSKETKQPRHDYMVERIL